MTPAPLPPGRRMPDAWIVRLAGAQPSLFLDMGRALAYAAKMGGTLGALYEGAPPDVPQQGSANEARQ